jgi:hypothetical protein
MSTNKFKRIMNDVPSKYQGNYKVVNLDSSDISSSLSRTHSTSNNAVNRSWNRMPDATEINRGKDAKEFRERLKRSTSRKEVSIERNFDQTPKYELLNKKPSRMNRAASERSVLVKNSHELKGSMPSSNLGRHRDNSTHSNSRRQNLFNQSTGNLNAVLRHKVSWHTIFIHNLLEFSVSLHCSI